MSMAESLEIVQKLYEEGFLTYPRTNSEYLATAEKAKIKSILENCKKIGYPVEFKDKKTIFDDSKIESHSAITPTYKIPDKNRLSEKEMQVYSTVFRRFVAVFCAEECIAEKVEITISVGELEDFVLKGLSIREKGWMKYDDATQKDKVLPKLAKGDAVNVDFKPVEKETTPPKHYTIETLNNYLKNPFREDKAKAEDEDDAEEYRAMFEGLELGTEATRTGIIDNARKSGYIELKKDVYRILPSGEYFIESLTKMSISMDKYQTVKLGQALKKVYRGEFETDDAVSLAKQEISQVFSLKQNTGFYGDRVGQCPICKSEMAKGRYGYGCMGYKDGCKFRINDYICKRVITVDEVKELLQNGKTSKLTGFISKNGKPFDAVLKLENGSVVFEF
jgi:DNA topoisomerase-3